MTHKWYNVVVEERGERMQNGVVVFSMNDEVDWTQNKGAASTSWSWLLEGREAILKHVAE